MYAPRMALQGTLIHFIKLACRSKSVIADFPTIDLTFLTHYAPGISIEKHDSTEIEVRKENYFRMNSAV